MHCEVLRLCECSIPNDVNVSGGPVKRRPHVRGGSELGSYEDFDACIEGSGSGKFIMLYAMKL